MLAPAMNEGMWLNRATRRNLELLASDGCMIVQPGTGELACGDAGTGRMAEPEEITEALERSFRGEGLLSGKRILVTAGRTEEMIDSVRYLTNRSSGRMGFAIARRAAMMGARVTLVHGAVDIPLPETDRAVQAQSAMDMKKAVLELFRENDILIMTAAVSDYTPVSQGEGKIRRESERLKLELKKTDDILKLAGGMKGKDKITVGFALEESEDEKAAMKKLEEKNCDLLVMNMIGGQTGFSVPTNRISIFGPAGKVLSTSLISKEEAAGIILEQLAEKSPGE
jgi:phosphopantothenoylcysteine decarboxylase/phosphopantothenate--cysteine ligase